MSAVRLVRRILITGASGYLGHRLVEALCAEEWVEAVVGLDIRRSACRHPKYRFFERDIREPLKDMVGQHEIDSIVHLAYIMTPLHDRSAMEDVNMRGARNMLEAAGHEAVRYVLHVSSVTAYGFHADNPVPLTEDSPLRGNDDLTYAKNKRQIEALVRDFARAHPSVSVGVLRPGFVLGPGHANPLAKHLLKKVVFLPRRTSPFQFLHVDDLLDVLVHFLEKKVRGVYNVAGEGTVDLPEMVKALGNIRIPLSWPSIYLFNQLFWLLRVRFITEVPSATLKGMVHPCVVTCDKLARETGVRLRFDSRGAFEAFAESVKHARPSADEGGTDHCAGPTNQGP